MLDLTRPVQTRDGKKARVICSDRKNSADYPVVALIEEDEELINCYTRDGKFFHGVNVVQHGLDLVNVPELDPTKPVQARNGIKARIVSTKLEKPFCLGVILEYHNGEEEFFRYPIDGTACRLGSCGSNEDSFDLINVS